MCVSGGVGGLCGHEGICPQRPEELKFPGAGVTDLGEQPDAGAENQTWVLWKSREFTFVSAGYKGFSPASLPASVVICYLDVIHSDCGEMESQNGFDLHFPDD